MLTVYMNFFSSAFYHDLTRHLSIQLYIPYPYVICKVHMYSLHMPSWHDSFLTYLSNRMWIKVK